jgi:H+/Cl- antiporter ClcA
VLFPSLLASAVATVVFVLLSHGFFETLYRFPAYPPRVVDLFYGAPLGLIGAVVGLAFMLSLRRLQGLLQPMKGHVVLRELLGGLAMAVNLVFPGIPVTVIVAATMACALVAALKAPLYAALFTTTPVQKETAAVIAVAVVISALLTALLTLRAARRAAAQAQPLPETT